MTQTSPQFHLLKFMERFLRLMRFFSGFLHTQPINITIL